MNRVLIIIDISCSDRDRLRFIEPYLPTLPDGVILRDYILATSHSYEAPQSQEPNQILSMLSLRKQRTVHELRRSHDGQLWKYMKALTPFEGLWADLKLGFVGRCLPMMCKDVRKESTIVIPL